MKLTKGKISKLYNKKRQSLKKPKRRKLSNKRRTFRNKRRVNLARGTLKKFNYKKSRGGAEDAPKDEYTTSNISPIEQSIQDTAPQSTLDNIEPFINQPVMDNNNNIETQLDQPNADASIDDINAMTSVEEPIAETPVEEPIAETPVEEPIAETPVEEPIAEMPVEEPIAEIPVEEPIAETPVEEPIAETPVEEPIVEMPVEEPISETPVEEPISETPVEEPISETPVEEPIAETKESIPSQLIDALDDDQPSSIETTSINETTPTNELASSISTVANYFADVIAEKVSQNISAAKYGETPQDGFNSVNQVAETMATSGGKKFKKTRRFRLINNKTRNNH